MQDSMVISFCIIAYNAELYIGSLLENLCKQTYPHEKIQIVMVDGKSTDTTKYLMKDFQNKHYNEFFDVQVLDNAKRTLPCGWNVALKVVSGEAILRVDAHTIIPNDFIEKNVALLESGKDICGGKVISMPSVNSSWSRVLNMAENSMFGGSFALFRRADNARYVHTAAFAIYRKEVFKTVGEFNELLTRTEDNEMHYRMRKAGYEFYYDPTIVSYRKTRPSLRGLVKQKFLNGYWIGLTLGVEPKCFSLYHYVPFLFIILILTTTTMAILGIWQLSVLMWSLYWFSALLMSIIAAIKERYFCTRCLLLPVLFLLLHISYGFGTIIGILKMPGWKKQSMVGKKCK